MISEAKAFWDPISGKVKDQIAKEMGNALQVQRYDVTTDPDGTVMGVTQPFGSNEIFLPYSKEVAGATVGDTVLVAWWGSMSNARVYYFAKGYDGAATVPAPTYNQTNITSGTHDLNDYKTPGLYYFSSGTTLSNVPNGAVNGWLWVLKSAGNQFKQIWVRHGSNPNTTKDFYMRFYSGSWGNWFGWMNRWELLWENASPTSAFAAQTISLNLSGYDFILVRGMYYNYLPSADMSWHIFKVGETYTQAMACMRGDGSEFSRRLVTVATTGVTFTNGGINVSGVSGDRVAIPEEIYGIKGVG